MSVYVDALMPCIRNKNWPYNQACHLIADTVDELHLFVKRIGLKRQWFQNNTIPHYDLTENVRLRAVKAGAVEIDSNKLVELIKLHRFQSGCGLKI